jgi:hypothetical protein
VTIWVKTISFALKTFTRANGLDWNKTRLSVFTAQGYRTLMTLTEPPQGGSVFSCAEVFKLETELS